MLWRYHYSKALGTYSSHFQHTHTQTLEMGAQEPQLESRGIPCFQLKLERQNPFDINNWETCGLSYVRSLLINYNHMSLKGQNCPPVRRALLSIFNSNEEMQIKYLHVNRICCIAVTVIFFPGSSENMYLMLSHVPPVMCWPHSLGWRQSLECLRNSEKVIDY